MQMAHSLAEATDVCIHTTSLFTFPWPGYEKDASETRVLQLEKRVEEVARQANSAHIQVHEVELQLQASLASTYNGGFLWRIPDISRRRRDAVEERVMSLYSPPFYTARYGNFELLF